MYLRELVKVVEPARVDEPGEVVFARLEHSPDCPIVAVVDGDMRPVGVIERNAFLARFAGPYGRAVYGQRPVTLLMDVDPLIVEAGTLISEFTRTAIEAHPGQLLGGFVIVEQGRYLGIGGGVDVLRAAARERAQIADRLTDLADRLQASNYEAQRQRRFAEEIIEHLPVVVVVRSERTGQLVLLNLAAEQILGVPRDRLMGRTLDEITDLSIAGQLRALIDHGGDAHLSPSRVVAYRPADGAPERLLRSAGLQVEGPGGDPLYLTIAEDVTEASRAHARITQLAHFDSLTGLANRAQFYERLTEALASAPLGGPACEVAVLTIDVDRFKTVNDTLGHSAGDRLLQQVARRLVSLLRVQDVAARLGGDEFAVLIREDGAGRIAQLVAERLTRQLAQPFNLGGHMAYIGGSVGIAVWTDAATDAEDLMRQADIALYRAKAAGRGVWRHFDHSMQAELAARAELERDLRLALENGEMAAHYQPLIDLAGGHVVGFEALLRWQHPTRGAISPAHFVPVAEENGLIGPLGEWVIRKACAMAARLPAPISVAVNVSAVQFRQPGLVPTIVQALANSNLAPERLEIEVTESALMSDGDQVLAAMQQLRELGVRIALDDFGTGYAALGYLQRFPFDKIKIDQSFTAGLPTRQSSAAIVAAVCAMAGQLGMTTIAEGVETPEQLEAVRRLGCTEAQGFLIGAPCADPLALISSTFAQQALG